ncbi:MAG: hypothetical protein AAF908_07360 [Pseudomonadota bacterium]
MKIALVAGEAYPDLSPSNWALRDALEASGAEVSVLLWNRDGETDFLDPDLCVLRQTWDYQDDPGGFAAWASRAEALGARLTPPAPLAIWNNDKRSLVAFGGEGIAIPATVPLTNPTDRALASLPTERIVVKPAFGGSGVGVHLSTRADLARTLADVGAEAPGRPLMAQEFLPEIAEGEWKMTCIEGEVALTIRAVPRGDAFRINSRFDPEIAVADPPADAARTARRICALLGRPLVARIDGVMRGAGFICTEVELTDPDLFLDRDSRAANLLAQAILRHARGPASGQLHPRR